MTREPVLFRVDATAGVGYEHLTRCLAFAAALQRRRRPAHLLAQLDPPALAFNVKRGGNEWLPADGPLGGPGDLERLRQEVLRIQPAAVVVDGPGVTGEYLSAVREMGVVVMAFDSLATSAFPAHLVVNPLLGPSREGYEHGRGTQLLLGKRYAIVRPEVRRIRPLRAQEPAQPFRVLVCLGDDDLANRSGELAKLLLNCPRVGRVDVIVRSHHRDLDGLKALATACPDRLEVVTEGNEVPLRISRAHLALTAGNNWSLELACVGVPQLVLVQAEVHWPTAQQLEEAGTATCLGWHATVSMSTVRQAVSMLLSDPLERLGMSRSGRKLIDGRGLDRLVTGLELVLQRARRRAMPALAA